jgi:sec-independent protein translocase protein TatB
VADDLKKATSPKAMGLDAVRSAADKFEKWDPIKNAAKPSQPMTPSPVPASAPVATAAETATVAVPEVGPATAALYQQKAARKAVVTEAAAKLKAISVPAAAGAAEAPAKASAKAPGRRRKKTDISGGDEA